MLETKQENLDGFVANLNHVSFLILNSAIAHGFYDKPVEDGTKIALAHSELSEALEGLRKNLPSDHIAGFLMVEEEMADTIIRVLDHCCWRGWRVGEAMVAKMAYNAARPFMHGGKAF